MGKIKKCIVPACPSATPTKHVFLISKSRREWFKIIGENEINTGYVCEDHFSDKNFTNSLNNRLKKDAFPDKLIINEEEVREQIPNYCIPVERSQVLVKRLGVKRVKELNVHENFFYKCTRRQKSQICKLKTLASKSQQNLRRALKVANTSFYRNLEQNLGNTGFKFFLAQTRNCLKLNRGYRWTTEDKIFALALYKRGARSYRFLQRFFKLPSKSTIQETLSKFIFDTGINDDMLHKLEISIQNLKPIDRVCSLIFDEISLAKGCVLDPRLKKVTGYVDLGSLGRKNILADHALVFMVNGLHKIWKQPIAYYFTKNSISTDSLKQIIVEIISKLQSIGLKIVCCLADQGATNAAALKQLVERNGSVENQFFLVNGDKIAVMHDPPHLLKNIRNALLHYNIQFDSHKIAKWEHIQNCYEIDSKNKFRMLYKINPEHLHLAKSFLKMRVCIAARTMSHTMAATISTMVAGGLLPADAFNTAEFVASIDKLFDSFNGTKPYLEKNKILKSCINRRSGHITFWNKMILEMQNWKFIDKITGEIRKTPKCLNGWISTMRGIKTVWQICEGEGFKFLRGRALNQDPIENLFSIIRQCGHSNINPTPYQFGNHLKSIILNSLIAPRAKNPNCEDDEGKILNTLQSFLDDATVEKTSNNLVLNEWNIPNSPVHLDFIDKQALAYVCGFLIKKVNIQNCYRCKNSVSSPNLEEQHIFTYFKEFSDKLRVLNYVSRDFLHLIAQIYNIIYILVLPNYGFENNIKEKIIHCLNQNLSLDWFQCPIHLGNFKNNVFQNSINLLFKKFYSDQTKF